MAATYEPIATTTASGSSSSITFSSISSAYTDLVLVANASVTSGSDTAILRFNGDTGSNYSRTFLSGNGSSTFSEVQQKLSDLYGGSAAANAETFQGKIDRLKVGFDEAKEALGTALLPQVERFIGFLNTTGIPALNAFIGGLTGDAGLVSGLEESQKGFATFGKVVSGVIGIVQGFITFIREAVGLLVEFANQAIRVINIVKPGTDIGYIPNPSLTNTMLGQSVPTIASTPNARENRTTVNNITVKAVDSEGAARAVAKVLSQSSARSIPALSGSSVRGN